MKLLNYVFYRMYWWNTKIVKDFTPFLSALIIVSVLQGFNLIFIFEIIAFYIFKTTSYFSTKYFLFIGTLTFILDFFYYKFKNRYLEIVKECSNISKKNKQIYDVLVIVYVIATFTIVILLGDEIRR